VTAQGGTEADRAARERLAREARVTATTLLDWVGTRVEGAATTGTTRPEGTRPRQSPGPCGWCPVCALVAAVRGEQPELTAHLAEQASGLLIVLRLLIQSHAHDHPAHEQPASQHPAHEQPVHEHPTPTGPDAAANPSPASPSSTGAVEPEVAADVLSNPDVPWDAPHAVFDPDPVSATPAPDGSSRTAPDRPTGKRGPRPSPRPRPVDVSPTPTATADRATVAGTPIPDAPVPATPLVPPTPAAATRVPASAAPTASARSDRGVQRIPVRRRPRPC
jgi:hypothetical protein